MKKHEAVELFRRDVLPWLDAPDQVALRCAWNDFIDALAKGRHITQRQAETWVNPYDKPQTKRRPRSAYGKKT